MPQQRAQAQRPGQEGDQNEGGTSLMRQIVQGLVIFMFTQFLMGKFMGTKQNDANPADPNAQSNQNPANVKIPAFKDRSDRSAMQHFSIIPQVIAPIWDSDSAVDVRMYVSPSLAMTSLSSMPSESLVLDEKSFTIGDWNDQREISKVITVPAEVQHNSTLWGHIYVALTGYPVDPDAEGYDIHKAFHVARPLTQYLPKKRVRKERNLLAHEDGETVKQDDPQPTAPVYASYYHSNISLSFVPDSGTQNFVRMQPAVRQFVVLDPTGARDASGQNGWYYPILFENKFWQLREHMSVMNSTVKTLTMHISLNNIKNWKFTLMTSLDMGMKEQARQAAAGNGITANGDGSELEEVKRIIIDTNPYLLATTVGVSLLHMIFEMLAFKNDVSHFRKKKDVVGTSVRTIVANVVMQTVIFLYLFDNSEGTSLVILFSQGTGILIEAWKITKMVDVRIRPTPNGPIFPYKITFEDKHKLSDTEKKTQEYDQIAFKYMYIVAVPLLLAYAAYSVIYETHRSWYSFVITTLVGSVYAYGFLLMCPSLYINYRLKSVAHMPGKAMTYKFLNTFIDDLFAFTVKMPTLHRLATLRDDVIFFIYLYQCWIYRVDYTRVNEFGQGGDDKEEEAVTASIDGSAATQQDASGRETSSSHARKRRR